MEFRCRLATATGQITEGTYVADSEAALRRDLEEKGLYLLDVKPAAWGGLSWLTRRRGGRIKMHEFLVFNQELATLLKAGMPLVQSLDILRRNVPNADLQGRARRRPRQGALGRGPLGRLRGARAALLADLHGVADGRRAQRQPRTGAASLRRVRAGAQCRPAQDHLGAGLSGRPGLPLAGRGRHHRHQGRAGVQRLLRQLRRRAALGHAHHRGAVSDGSAATCWSSAC